ncbi:hypothetical protein EMIT0111MI5_110127 [Burkholderia sp. IT-111MI5]
MSLRSTSPVPLERRPRVTRPSPSALRQRNAADTANAADKIISYFSPNPDLINIERIKH